METIDRVICGALGASMFASVTYVAVMEAGGVTSEDAPILITVGLGAIGAAYYTGHAWRTGAWPIAVLLVLGIIAAELSNFQRTLERLAVLSCPHKVVPFCVFIIGSAAWLGNGIRMRIA